MSRKPPPPDGPEPYYPNLDAMEITRLPLCRDESANRAVRAIYSLSKASELVEDYLQFKWENKRRRLLQINVAPGGLESLMGLLNDMAPDCCVVDGAKLVVDLKKLMHDQDQFKHMGRLANELNQKHPNRLM